ncbi:hypothetical protein TrRE_jg12645, partial [Triparma retinervis]
ILDCRNPPTSACGQVLSLINSLPPSPTPALLSAYIPLTSYPLPSHIPIILHHISTLNTPFSYSPSSLPPSLPQPVLACLMRHGGIGGLLMLLHTLNYTQSVLTLLSTMPDVPPPYVHLYAASATSGEPPPANYMSLPLGGGATVRNLCSTHGSFVSNLLEWKPGDITELLKDDRGEVHVGLRQALIDALNENTAVPLVGFCNKVGGEDIVKATAVYMGSLSTPSPPPSSRAAFMDLVTSSTGSSPGDGELWVRASHECCTSEEVEGA